MEEEDVVTAAPSPWDPWGSFCCALIPFLGVPLASLYLVFNWRRLHPGERLWPLVLAVGLFSFFLLGMEHLMNIFRFPLRYIILGLPVSASYGLLTTMVQLPAWRNRYAGRPVLLGLGLVLVAGSYLALVALHPRGGPPLPPNLPSASVSRNWAGYQLMSQGITEVQAEWAVPSVSARDSSPQQELSTWVGIGGYRPGTVLLQAGTTEGIFNGHTRYFAFYELYPGMTERTAFPVHPGDTVKATVQAMGRGFDGGWQVSVQDLTTGRKHTQVFYDTPARESAEWIAEAPYLNSNNRTSPLPLFSPVHFASAYAATFRNGGSPGQLGASPLTMLGPGGVMASPSKLNAGGSSFTVRAH